MTVLSMFLVEVLSGLPCTFNQHYSRSDIPRVLYPYADLICISPSSLGSYYSTAVLGQQKAQGRESLYTIDGNGLVTISQLLSAWQNSHAPSFTICNSTFVLVCVSFALSHYGTITPIVSGVHNLSPKRVVETDQ